MSTYRNIKCNISQPSTIRDYTALAIHDVLDAAGGLPVLSADVDAAILASPFGSVQHRADAVKALRNIGYPIIARKARHKSSYALDPHVNETEAMMNRIITEAYSQAVTTARLLAGAVSLHPQDLIIADAHRHQQLTAIGLGTSTAVGLTASQAAVDCVPL